MPKCDLNKFAKQSFSCKHLWKVSFIFKQNGVISHVKILRACVALEFLLFPGFFEPRITEVKIWIM